VVLTQEFIGYEGSQNNVERNGDRPECGPEWDNETDTKSPSWPPGFDEEPETRRFKVEAILVRGDLGQMQRDQPSVPR
jgi:hypothetical protein